MTPWQGYKETPKDDPLDILIEHAPRIRRKWYLRIRYITGEGDNRYLMSTKECAYAVLDDLDYHIAKHDTMATFRFGTSGEKAIVRLTDIHSITVIGEPPTGQIK